MILLMAVFVCLLLGIAMSIAAVRQMLFTVESAEGADFTLNVVRVGLALVYATIAASLLSTTVVFGRLVVITWF
jgi:hypothetical protein